MHASISHPCGRTTGVSIFLAVDGGGTKTSCLVGDEQSVLGHGAAGPSNVVRVGEAQARESLAEAIEQACRNASVNPRVISRTCIGIAGGARPQVADVIKRFAATLVGGQIQVVGDMVIVLEAGFHGDAGVVVITGTGSISYGRNASGQTARAGGWGFAISDEGSAHWIGRAAVSRAMRTHAEGESGSMLQRLMKVWNVKRVDEMVVAANAPEARFTDLFPEIVSAAEMGERTACEVLSEAGRELAELASVVVLRLFGKDEAVQVAMAGGVFRNAELVRNAFYNELKREHSRVQINDSIVEPVEGALWLARKAKT